MEVKALVRLVDLSLILGTTRNDLEQRVQSKY